MVNGQTRRITEDSDPGDLISSARAREILQIDRTWSFVRLARQHGLIPWQRSWSKRLLWSEAEVRQAFRVEQRIQRI